MDGPKAIEILSNLLKLNVAIFRSTNEEKEAIKYAISTIESILVSNEEVN